MISITQQGSAIKIAGELSRFDSMNELAINANGASIDVDITELTVDTAGLAWMLKQKLVLAEQDCQVSWLNPSDKIQNLALISGVNEILGV